MLYELHKGIHWQIRATEIIYIVEAPTTSAATLLEVIFSHDHLYLSRYVISSENTMADTHATVHREVHSGRYG